MARSDESIPSSLNAPILADVMAFYIGESIRSVVVQTAACDSNVASADVAAAVGIAVPLSYTLWSPRSDVPLSSTDDIESVTMNLLAVATNPLVQRRSCIIQACIRFSNRWWGSPADSLAIGPDFRSSSTADMQRGRCEGFPVALAALCGPAGGNAHLRLSGSAAHEIVASLVREALPWRNLLCLSVAGRQHLPHRLVFA
jgi:hypothetical protein